MANPQKENGHVRIANEILDVLARSFFNSREWNVIIFVIRKTWGFNKKTDNIPLSQFQKGCFLTRSQVCKILNSLVSQRILVKVENGYGFNKNYDEWVVSQGRRSITADNALVSQQTTKLVSQQTPSIDNIKNNYSKDSSRPPQKKYNKVNGESDRGKDVSFDSFLDECKKKNIYPAIGFIRYFALQEEYKLRVVWWPEVRGCINWLFDNGFNQINAQRLRKRMDNAIRFAKEREIKRLQENQDKKFAPQKVLVSKDIPLWTPPL